MRQRFVSLSVCGCLLSAGCQGYFPLRAPRADLWQAKTAASPSIPLPDVQPSAYSLHSQQEGVTFAIEVFDARRSQEAFGANLPLQGISPVMVLLHNGSDTAFLFHKAHVRPLAVIAKKAARRAYVHPLRRVYRSLKWAALFVPGLLMQSLVEPLTTLDFPGFQEASRRPEKPNHNGIQAAFIESEIKDGAIEPSASRTGWLFVPTLVPGKSLQVDLVDASTLKSLSLKLKIPLASVSESRDYLVSSKKVWDVAIEEASKMPGWRLISADEKKGTMEISYGTKFIWVGSTGKLLISIQEITPEQTLLRLEDTQDSAKSLLIPLSRRAEKFLGDLDSALPMRPPEPVLEESMVLKK
ncbi:MAG: hypothetical protein HYT88_03180 [Candidatus Omnitrophica bacterium]|nr:hypothetical protein [Candidatus Omnitrophota bacterium]